MKNDGAKIVPPGEGKDYDLFLNRPVIKLSGKDTGGSYTIIEDQIESGFVRGMHVHREHEETFYVLDGEFELMMNDNVITATPGTTIHVPPNTPHAARANKPCRLLIIFSPAGFEELLETYSQLKTEQFEDTEFMRSLQEQYDFYFIKE